MNKQDNIELNRATKPHKIIIPPPQDEYIPSQIPNVARGCQPSDCGWLEMRLDKSDMDCLWKYIETAKKKNVNINHQLAGNITESLLLEDKDDYFFNKVVDPLCGTYHHLYGETPQVTSTIAPHPLMLSSMWVNFQKKHEFNPTHNHYGVFSFVIFMKIPTDFEDQKKLSIANKANSGAISNFIFTFTDLHGRIRNHPVKMSPEYEGIMFLFPSSLIHQVFPFYESDETRITISGNATLNTNIKYDSETGSLVTIEKSKEKSNNYKTKKQGDSLFDVLSNGQYPFSEVNPSPQERSLFSGL